MLSARATGPPPVMGAAATRATGFFGALDLAAGVTGPISAALTRRARSMGIRGEIGRELPSGGTKAMVQAATSRRSDHRWVSSERSAVGPAGSRVWKAWRECDLPHRRGGWI